MKKITNDFYIEKLESVDKKIIVKDEGLKITEDALLLSNFVKRKLDTCSKEDTGKNTSILLEIGAGQGTISLLLSEIKTIEKIYAVELQESIFKHLNENIKINQLEDKIIGINEDIKDIQGEYGYIVSNPPYRKVSSGRLPENESERISKYEVSLTLEGLFMQIRRLLKNYGEFFVIVPDERLNDSFSYIYKNNMNVLELEINKYRKRNLVIIHGKKGGNQNSGINIETVQQHSEK